MAAEFKGEEFLYLVEVTDGDGGAGVEHRLFNQTSGSTSSEADAVELSTKDKTGSDYGTVAQTVSIEGVLTDEDPAVAFVKKAQRNKQFIKIIEVNTRNESTESGMYMISSFERSFAVDEHATYTIEASLNGKLEDGTLTTLPEGAE